LALYELMDVTDAMRDRIVEGVPPTTLKRFAMEEGMRTLRGSGIQKVIDGVTSVEEVLSTTISDNG